MNRRKNYIVYGIAGAIIFLGLRTQAQTKPEKVSHAEPLYIDLVRDLGARKGEKEINVAADFITIRNYRAYGLLAEYEFAPVNHLGVEVETDFSFIRKINDDGSEVPGNRLECVKLSAQYSFFVSPKINTTLAVGYTQVVDLTAFTNYGHEKLITGTVYNPFFIAARRWGANFHTLVFAGPLLTDDNGPPVCWQINTSVHYTIPQTRHFVGIEFNKEISQGSFKITIRPQVKVRVNKNMAIGFVAGFPVNEPGEGTSSFVRMIYEF